MSLTAYIAYCQACDHHTYLMAAAKGKYKASRKNGVVLGIACSRCKRVRAVSSELHNLTEFHDRKRNH